MGVTKKYVGMPVDEFVDRHVLSMITQSKLVYYYRDPEKFSCIDHEVKWVKGGWLVFNPIGGMLGSCLNIDGFARNNAMKKSIVSIIRREFEGVRKNWDNMIYLEQ